MKKHISAFVKITSLLLLGCMLFGGCAAKDRPRPTMGFQVDRAPQTVVFQGNNFSKDFENNKSVKLSGNDLAYFYNYDNKAVNKLAFSGNIILPTSGKAGIVIATYTDAQGTQKYIKAVASAAEKKAYLVSYSDDSSEIIFEYQIKTDLSKSVLMTAEYNKGVLSFWIEEEYLFKKSYDLTQIATDFSFFGGFVSEDCDAEFRFIKVFGVVNCVEFDPATITEGCTDVAEGKQYMLVTGDAKKVEYGAGKMISRSGANRIEITNLGLDVTKPIAYSYTLNTIEVNKSWNGFRPTFLQDAAGNQIKLFSLDGSITVFYYDAKTKKDVGDKSYTYNREYGTPEEFIVYFRDGMMYVFLNGQLIIEYMIPETEGGYTAIFKPLFEFGNSEVTNIKIYQANDVAVYK